MKFFIPLFITYLLYMTIPSVLATLGMSLSPHFHVHVPVCLSMFRKYHNSTLFDVRFKLPFITEFLY